MRIQKMQKKSAKSATYKGKKGFQTKRAVNTPKIFSGVLGIGCSLSFQVIKCKNFCQEKAENANKCEKCNNQGGKATKRPSNKIQRVFLTVS